jgi:hypothetical protein
MRKLFSILAAGVLVAAAGSANAVPFTATAAVQVGALPPVTANGSGSGTSAGAGGAASIPGGVFSIATTAPINPPLLVINGFGVGAPGQGGYRTLNTTPLSPGSNKGLTFGGVTGTMGLSASAYLITGLGNPPTLSTPTPTNLAAAIPLAIVGVGCNPFCPPPLFPGGLIMGTIMANPYQLGMVTVMGALNGVPSAVMGTGFDNRTAGGLGTLQLVSPTVVALGALGSLARVAELSITIVPEPATALLVGLGLAALGAMRARSNPQR